MWRQGMDFQNHPRHLQSGSGEPAYMSAQQSFLHCVCHLVRSRYAVPPLTIVDMILYFAIRGLIGPSRQFGPNSIYHAQLYALIAGAVLPVPFWIMHRRRPDSWAKYVSTPVVLLGVSFIPPATGINYSAWFAVGFVFQFVIRKRNFAWWCKYNYITGAALDCGQYCHVTL
jgi:hypothetical protein